MWLGLLVVVGFAVAWFVWDRSNELFALRIREGRVEVVRGTPPVAFLQVVRDVANQPVVVSGKVRAVKAEGGVSIRGSGLTDGQLQRLRNAFKLSPQSAYRSGEGPVNERNFWRAIGIAWLIELLFRR